MPQTVLTAGTRAGSAIGDAGVLPDGSVPMTADLVFSQTVGAEPTENDEGLDSFAAAFEARLWDGAAAVTRTGRVRFGELSGIDDQGQFVFSSDDNGGAENDFLFLFRDSAGNGVIRPAAGENLRLHNNANATVFEILGTKTRFLSQVWETGVQFTVLDNTESRLGTGGDIVRKYSTIQTNNGLMFGLQGAEGNYVILTAKARVDTNFGLPAFTNPTSLIHDGSADMSKWGGFSHDGTDLLLAVNAGAFSVDVGIRAQKVVEANTAVAASPNVLTAAESRKVLTNEGATAENHHDLPPAVANLEYTFYVQDVDGMQINAATGDTIRIAATVSAAAGFISSTTIGDAIRLQCINATEWVAVALGGNNWTFDV